MGRRWPLARSQGRQGLSLLPESSFLTRKWETVRSSGLSSNGHNTEDKGSISYLIPELSLAPSTPESSAVTTEQSF